MPNSDTKTSPKDSRSLRDILGGVLFYFGIPAFTLYPLGFMALSLQLWRDPVFPYNWASSGLDFTIIWYAASLIPKVVVIGTGVKLLAISLLSTILIMSVAAITLHLLREWNLVKGWVKHEEQNTVSGWRRLNKWERRFWLLSLVVLLPITVFLVAKMFPFDHLYDLPFYGGYVIFSAVGGIVLGYIRYWGHNRWLHHGLSLAFAGAIFAALSLSALELPDLPYVELNASSTWPENLPSSTPFTLLANDSNHWYVYNRESGVVSVNHPENPSGAAIMRFWDQVERPDVDIGLDDGRLNYDPDSYDPDRSSYRS
jgi:hypothetical protein